MEVPKRVAVRLGLAALLMTSLGLATPASSQPLGPLDEAAATVDQAAAVVGALGQQQYSDTFAGLQVDPHAGRLTVFVTNAQRGEVLLTSARTLMPASVGKVPVDVVPAKYSRRDLEAARTTLWGLSPEWTVHGVVVRSISVPGNGAGLEVTTNDEAGLRRLLANEVPKLNDVAASDVRVHLGGEIRTVSRANDYPPYWSGIPVKGDFDFSYRCTTAFSMIANGGKRYLMTADHCFDLNNRVEEPNGTLMGYTRVRNSPYDATGIEVSTAAGVYLSDTNTDYFNSTAYSWNGQLVCQSGYTSARTLPICNIQVVNDNIEWIDDTGARRRGVQGSRCPTCISVRHGDSGGPVWNTAPNGNLESRGIVSAGNSPTGDGFRNIFWTETLAIVGNMGGSLIVF